MLDIKYFNGWYNKMIVLYPKMSDIVNTEHWSVWYEVMFKNYTEKQIDYMFTKYIEHETFAPQSPASIKKYLDQGEEQRIKNNVLSANKAWELVRATNRYAPIRGNRFKEIVGAKSKIAVKVTEAFVHELGSEATSQQWDITSHAWKKAYDIEVKRIIDNKKLGLDSEDYNALLHHPDPTMIENKED